MLTAAGSLQFAEEQPTPENADEGVGIPERKCDGQADIANGEDGKRVGYCPQHSGEDGDGDEVAVLGEIGEDLARAFEQSGDGPARSEDARHHAQRDGVGRKAGVDELGGRLSRA